MTDSMDATGRYNWKQLDHAWIRVQERWHDRTTEYFFKRYLDPLDDETQSLLHALEELTEALDAAQDEARRRW